MINFALIARLVFLAALFFCAANAFAHGRPNRALDKKLIQSCAKGDLQAVGHFLSKGANPNAMDPNDGRTPLMETAGHRNSSAIIALLANHGANVNARGYLEMTPLMWAASDSDLGAVKTLVALGAKVDSKDSDGQTALFALDGAKSFEIAQILLAHHANPTIRDKVGDQPIHEAEDIPCVQLLLAHGADINAQDNDDLTPLALTGGGVDFIKYLLDHGANPNIRDADGVPAWMEHLNDAGDIKFFLDRGVDINVRDGFGRTPLLQAASVDDADVVALLIAHGADVNAKTPHGDTAYSVARHRHDDEGDEIVGLLVKAGEKDAHPIPKLPDILLSPQSDEARVAHAVLAASRPGGRELAVFIQDTGFYRNSSDIFEMPTGPGIPAGLLAAFRASREPSKVYPAFKDLPWVHSVRNSEIEAVFKNGGWDNFFEKFPGTSGFCAMSLPVFDKRHRIALIYASYTSGGFSGAGYLYLLHRGDRGWKVVKEVGVWIS